MMDRPDPAALARRYARFRVAERVLLTGHSHQAWPDCARDAQLQAWDDAALHVDDKWDRAFAMAARVRAGYAERLDDRDGVYTLSANTHDLLVRFLSALPLRERPRLVTTDGEFHTVRRQLARLAEAGVPVTVIPAEPVADLATRLAAAVDQRTAAVLVSSVLFRTARIVPGLDDLARRCAHHGAELLVDAYHAVNAVPFSLCDEGLERAWVVGGGYKYCQLGEGNAFLRAPAGCALRPVVTGWFAEFGALSDAPENGTVTYADGPARFAGATHDPVSQYRGAAVWDFFAAEGLDVARLRDLGQHQLVRLAAGFDALDLDPALIARDRDVPLRDLGGFLVLDSPRAATFRERLRARGIWTDHRDHALRLGPAPYVTDAQLDLAIAALGEVARELGRDGP